MPIPNIDERVKYVGASALRGLNAKTLREIKDVLVIQVDERPAAVVVPYDLYMRMQEAVWPSSLLPALEKFLSGESAAEMKVYEDDKASVFDNPGQCPECYRMVSITNGTLGLHATTAREDMDEVNPKACVGSWRAPVTVRAIGTDMTPRGAKFARVDDGNPPVFDDIDYPAPPPMSQVVLDSESDVAIGSEPACVHCLSPSEKTLCSECFLAGHRNGTCLKCAEGDQPK